VQQNFKKKFSFLTRGSDQGKKNIYRLIKNLPLCEDSEIFLENYNEIQTSELLSSELKLYLENKFNEKTRWVKAYMKSHFCAGMCTTSRIESKHGVFKRFLKSSTSLCELFNVIRTIERQEISAFTNEIDKINKKSSSNLENSNLIKYFRNEYSEYLIIRLKSILIESTNYTIDRKSQNIWLFILLFFCNISRNIERNGHLRKVKLRRGSLECDCKDNIFIGIPCRHMIAAVTKEKGLSFKNLPILERWKTSYYNESVENDEPLELSLQPEDQSQELSQDQKSVVRFSFLF